MKIVIFTGSGISAESGLSTFRGGNGLWDNHPIEEICTPEALKNNRSLVIDFYNIRRKELLSKIPNAAHIAIQKLESFFEVEIITQNIDNLHERAGSKQITHLHGELMKLRSSKNPELIIPINDWEQKKEAIGKDGALLRPHIVFFGEPVPMFEKAIEITKTADIFIVIGTSLSVYPAASLLHYVKKESLIYLIDPTRPMNIPKHSNFMFIQKQAGEGVPILVEELITKQSKNKLF